MTRLIDADKLMEELDNIVYTKKGNNSDRHMLQIISAIQNAPTVDAVPLNEVFRVIAGHSNYQGDNILSALICIAEEKDVTPVRPVDAVEVVHAKWKESISLDEGFWICSNCNFVSEATAAPVLYKYCPNCGAKMDGERRDNV